MESQKVPKAHRAPHSGSKAEKKASKHKKNAQKNNPRVQLIVFKLASS